MRNSHSLAPLGVSLGLFVVSLSGCNGGTVVTDSGPTSDSGAHDTGAHDTGPLADGGGHDAGHDAATATDGGAAPDAGMDAGSLVDASALADSGLDAGSPGSDVGIDGATVDAGPMADAGACSSSLALGSTLGIAIASGDTAALTDHGVRSCGGQAGGVDVSFTWTAPAAGTYVIDTNGSAYDTVMDVLAGCGGTSIDCDDDGGEGSRSSIQATLTLGEVIQITVDAYHPDDAGHYQLNIGAMGAEVCTDGLDNDGDGDIDCADADCGTVSACDESMHCHDGLDNDVDGDVDCIDSDCTASDPTCVETACNDTIDNDGDGVRDCNDGDCSADPHCGESMCANTLDDDTDGAIDCADSECTCDAACSTPTDPCAAPIALGMATGDAVHTGSFARTACGSRNDASCGSGGDGPDATFRWTAPAAGTYVFDTFDTTHLGSTIDTVLAIRSTCNGAADEIDCADDSVGRLSRITAPLTAGETIFIVVDSYYPLEGGNYTLNIHAM